MSLDAMRNFLEAMSVKHPPAPGGFGTVAGTLVAALCLLGLAACDKREESSSGVLNHDPGNARVNQYAAALESRFKGAGSMPDAQRCKVHLIDARPSFDQAGSEKTRLYFVLTDQQGLVISADTCGAVLNECVATISKRSRTECSVAGVDDTERASRRPASAAR